MNLGATRTSRFAAAVGMLLIAAAASAQSPWVPASEILNQPVDVTTNKVTNRLTFGPDGQLTIYSPLGRAVNGSWTAANGQLCLAVGERKECWPYKQPFEAGQPVTITSSYDSVSTWVAAATNPSAPPPPSAAPPPEAAGERDR